MFPMQYIVKKGNFNTECSLCVNLGYLTQPNLEEVFQFFDKMPLPSENKLWILTFSQLWLYVLFFVLGALYLDMI